MKSLAVSALLASLVTSSFAETNAPHTPAQLHEMSTVVLKGTVVATAVKIKHKKAFPTGALVSEVVKGTLEKNSVGPWKIAFKHKDPGRFVIVEDEFNTPKIWQKGTFYLQDQDGTLVLIGYIKDAGQ